MATFSERVGDIFDSPPNSILIHACNTKGSWGAGVAAAFKKYSPSAFHLQKAHCNNPSPPSTSLATHQKSLVGTCLLIPPFPTIRTYTGKISSTLSKPTPQQEAKRFWIACLFTSAGYGKKVDTPASILKATETSVADLARQIADHMNKRRKIAGLKEKRENLVEQDGDDKRLRALTAQIDREEKESGGEMGGCYSVRINSGLFGVPWEETRRVLKKGDVNMIVVRPPSQNDEVVESDDDRGVETGEAQEEKNIVRVDGASGHKEEKVEAREGEAGAEKVDNAQVKKGLKRKIGEGSGEEEGKKKEVGGRQTKLKFGKGK
ncbi:MAG: hypothetical protein Q9178_002877 [Gyalolechia marmorata]